MTRTRGGHGWPHSSLAGLDLPGSMHEKGAEMRTTLVLDDDLLAEAQRLTGVKEKTVLVREGLNAAWAPSPLIQKFGNLAGRVGRR